MPYACLVGPNSLMYNQNAIKIELSNTKIEANSLLVYRRTLALYQTYLLIVAATFGWIVAYLLTSIDRRLLLQLLNCKTEQFVPLTNKKEKKKRGGGIDYYFSLVSYPLFFVISSLVFLPIHNWKESADQVGDKKSESSTVISHHMQRCNLHHMQPRGHQFGWQKKPCLWLHHFHRRG